MRHRREGVSKSKRTRLGRLRALLCVLLVLPTGALAATAGTGGGMAPGAPPFLQLPSHRVPAGSPLSGESLLAPIEQVVPAGQAIQAGFVSNHGQYSDARVEFAWVGRQLSIGFAESSLFLVLTPPATRELSSANGHPDALRLGGGTPAPAMPATALEVTFVNARRVSPVPEGETTGRVSYFVGNDPAQWRPAVPMFSRLRYEGLYPGVDLVYSATPAGAKYEFLVQPGGNVADVEWQFAGIQELVLADGGVISVTADGARLFDSPPVSDEQGRAVECSFELRSPRSVGFACKDRDPSLPLRIDPLLSVSYWGGSDYDNGNWLRADGAGNLYEYGTTYSLDFNATPGAYNSTPAAGASNVYVAKLNATRTGFEYVALLGGSGDEQDWGFAVDRLGAAYASGKTWSDDFPTTPGAFQTAFNGSNDGYLFKLSPNGSALEYSTRVGGSADEACQWIDVDSAGQVMVVGSTISSDFPTTPGAFDATYNGGVDGYAGVLDAAGSNFVFLTLLGGARDDYAGNLAADEGGNIYIEAATFSPDFPTTPGAFDTTYNGGPGWGDIALVKLSPDGSGLVYSTFLGGADDDVGRGVAVAGDGSAFVAGTTNSSDFPTTPGAFDRAFHGSDGSAVEYKGDAFLLRLDGNGTSLLFSTFLGGSGDDEPAELGLDLAGNPVVVGTTNSTDFPTTPNAFARASGGREDGFLTVLQRDGSGLLYSTYFGGAGTDWLNSPAFGPSGEVFVSGDTDSPDLPAAIPVGNQTHLGGSNDGFLLTFLVTAPELNEALPRSATVIVSWSPPPGLNDSAVLGYRLYPRRTGGPPIPAVALSNITSTFFLAANGAEYCFDVTAVTRAGETERSRELCAIPAGVPSPPRDLSAVAGEGSVHLTWSEPASSGGVSVTGYRVYRSEGGGNLTLIANVTAAGFTDLNVSNGTAYRYQVRAFNHVWDGDPSTEVVGVPYARGPVVAAGPIETPAVVLILALAVGAGAIRLSPRASYVFGAVVTAPLFTRLRKNDVRSHVQRGRLLQLIEDYPGVAYTDIRRRLALANGTCAYHLQVLERSGEIRRAARGAGVRFYPAAYKLPVDALPPLALLQRRILEFLLERPEAPAADVIDALRGSEPSLSDRKVAYHLKALARDKDLVLVRREEGRAFYSIDPSQRDRLRARLAEEVSADRFLDSELRPHAPAGRQPPPL